MEPFRLQAATTLSYHGTFVDAAASWNLQGHLYSAASSGNLSVLLTQHYGNFMYKCSNIMEPYCLQAATSWNLSVFMQQHHGNLL
jgi:hypothetical protein